MLISATFRELGISSSRIINLPSGSLTQVFIVYSNVLLMSMVTPLLCVEEPAITYSLFHSLARVFRSF